jgi:tRNA splicing endonuclease
MKPITISDQELIKKLFRIGAIGEQSEKAEIHPLLAAYLADKGILNDGEKILKAAKKGDKLAEDKIAVIKHLWSHGYITRVSLEGKEEYLRVHRKGIRPGEDRTQYLVKVVQENWKPKFTEILENIAFAGKLRKELVLAYLEGKEKQVRFIRIGRSSFD